jgi:hypothetical protein
VSHWRRHKKLSWLLSSQLNGGVAPCNNTDNFANWRGNDKLKIHFTPGERFSYSGEGFVYLAKVIEHVTGEKFNDFMKQTVFDPLGMASSSYVWRDDYDKLVTFRHNVVGEPGGQGKPPAGQANTGNAAGSLNTTARDYGRFVAAILNGTGLKPQTRKLMLTPQVQVREGGPSSIDRPQVKPVPDVAWGIGWGLQTTKDGLSFWHWGDNGDCKAFIVAFDKPKLAAVFFANSANGLSIAREIVAEAVGGAQPALDWLNYDRYDSPRRVLYRENAQEKTWPVGSLKPNDFGLFDMQGNVFTWCQERYKDNPQSKAGIFEDNEDIYSININEGRLLRGDSFYDRASLVRSSYRGSYAPAVRVSADGFRPARTYR